MATGWQAPKIVLLLCTISCSNVGIRFDHTSTVIMLQEIHLFGISCAIIIWYSFHQDAMKRPTFETLQWKLEDFFTMSDSEYKDASAYWPSYTSHHFISFLAYFVKPSVHYCINHTYILWHPSVNKLQCWTVVSFWESQKILILSCPVLPNAKEADSKSKRSGSCLNKANWT